MNHNLKILAIIAILVAATFLRIWRLDQVPAGLYWEEVAVGYDAYSIAQTGQDHHGHSWPIVAFESFGDYKPTFYFYVVAVFTKLVGLNVWSLRLPSALAGVSLVLVIGLLTRFTAEQMAIKSNLKRDGVELIAMMLATFSPWLIHFSRGGWESNFATALMMWGWWLILKSPKLSHWLLAGLLLGLAAYTYHAARIIAPGLLLIGLGYHWLVNYKRQKFKIKLLKFTFITFFMFGLTLIPLILPSNSKEVGHRFMETSIFANLDPILESNLRRERAGNSLISRIIYHRYVYFGKEMLSHAFTHLSPTFSFYLVMSILTMVVWEVS